METIRKSIAAFCAMAFIFTAIISLFVFNFDRKAFTAETYQKAFAREDFYNKLPSVMADAMTSSGADQGQFPAVLRGLGKEGWEAFFRSLLPPETLKVMGDDLLDSTFAYLNMQTDSAQLNLIPLKTSMAGDAGVQAVLSLLGGQPDCTFIQIAQMTIGLLSGEEIAFCKPPADLLSALTPVIQGQLQFTASVLPDQVTVISAPPQNDPRPRLKTTRLFMRLSPILPLALLLALTVFAVRSFKNWLSWWGVPFFITGSIAFVMSLLGAPVFGAIFQQILVSRMSIYLPTILLDYASDLAAVMVQALLNPVMVQGMVLVVVGFVMAVASYFVRKQRIMT